MIAKATLDAVENYWRTGLLEKNKKTFPNQIVTDKEVIDDPQKICEAFNVHFATVRKIFVKTLNLVNQPTLYHVIFPTRFFSPATVEEIFSLIGNIKIKKAVRENDITNKLLKLSNAVISPFLCNIFNSCIHQGGFPNSLKMAEVVPVFKKGTSNLLTNYRPSSILSQLCKIF